MKKSEKITLLILGIIIIIVVIILIINPKKNKKEIPDITINGESIDIVDDYLEDVYDLAKSKNYEISTVKFNNNSILSVLVKADKIDETYGHTISYYFSYNIDKNTKRLLSNEDIWNYFNITKEKTDEKIINQMKLYYDEEVNLGYVDSNECSIDCYLSFYRSIDKNYLENNYVLVIEDEHLYAYICFDKNSIIEDIEYFDNLDYNPNKIRIK